MMTKIKVTCKLAKFQPSWLKLPLKGISLGGTVFLVESFLSEQVIYFQVQVYEKKKVWKTLLYFCCDTQSKDNIYICSISEFVGNIYLSLSRT